MPHRSPSPRSRRPAVPLALAALAGAACGPLLPPAALVLLAGLALSALLGCLLRGAPAAPAGGACVTCLLLAAGAVYGLRAEGAGAAAGPYPAPRPRVLVGELLAQPEPMIGRRLGLRVACAGRTVLIEAPRHAVRGRPLPGATVRALGRLVPPPSPRDPGGYDRGRALARRGVALRCIAAEVVELRAARGPAALLAGFERHARALLRAGVAPERRAFFRTVVLGDRVPVAPELRRAFRESGTAHLLSLSGLHVGLVGGLVLLLARACGRGPAERKLVVAAALVLYLAVAGARVPTLRAAAAGVVLFLAPHRGDPWNRLAVAFLVVVGWDPEALWDLGLHLSFGIVAALLATGPSFARAFAAPAAPGAAGLGGPRAKPRWGRGVLAGGLSVFAASAPVVALRLGQLPLATLLLGVPAVALFAAVLTLALLGVAAGVVWPAAGVLVLGAADGLAALLILTIEHVARAPGSLVRVASAGPIAALLTTGVLAAAAVRREERRPARGLGLLGLLLLGALVLPRPAACAGSAPRHAPAPVGPRVLLRDGGRTVLAAAGGVVLGVGRSPRHGWLRAALRELDAARVRWLDGRGGLDDRPRSARVGAPEPTSPDERGGGERGGAEPSAPAPPRVRWRTPRAVALDVAAVRVLVVRGDRPDLDRLVARARAVEPAPLAAEVLVAPGRLGIRRTRRLLAATGARCALVDRADLARAAGARALPPDRGVDLRIAPSLRVRVRYDAP